MDFIYILTGLVPATSFLLAALVGRWWIALLPMIFWPVYYVGRDAGWWPGGLGEFWALLMLADMAAGLAAVGLGLLVRFLVRRAIRSRRRSD